MNELNEQALPIAPSSSMDYTIPDKLEWDLDKSERCEQQRGFNFEYAAKVLWDSNRYENHAIQA